LFFVDAKLLRESEENKKMAEILMELLRQSLVFATKRGKRFKSCPKLAADHIVKGTHPMASPLLHN
jgi:hypothetical protein